MGFEFVFLFQISLRNRTLLFLQGDFFRLRRVRESERGEGEGLLDWSLHGREVGEGCGSDFRGRW